MSTYNGNDSKIKIDCRTMAMTPANNNPVNLLVIAHPEKIDGEWICKDVEILRKSGANINHIVWVNNDFYLSWCISSYMDKYFSGKNTKITNDINKSISDILRICNYIGKLNLVYLDYCNLISPEHQMFWEQLVKKNVFDNECKVSITLQVHGRNFANSLWNKFDIEPVELISNKYYDHFGDPDRTEKYKNQTMVWEGDFYLITDYANKKLTKAFGSKQGFLHYNKNGLLSSKSNWNSIPLDSTIEGRMFFKTIFVISATLITESFKFKSNFKNGKAFIYDADGPNKMSFFSFTLEKSKKGLSKGTPKAKKAGAKRSATVAFQKKIKEAIDNDYSKQRIAGIKAAYTRKINQIEKLTILELTT